MRAHRATAPMETNTTTMTTFKSSECLSIRAVVVAEVLMGAVTDVSFVLVVWMWAVVIAEEVVEVVVVTGIVAVVFVLVITARVTGEGVVEEATSSSSISVCRTWNDFPQTLDHRISDTNKNRNSHLNL